MPDPIQVESAFQDLMIHLETTVSIRHRYSLLRDFLTRLDGEYKKYETYIIQLAEEVPFYKDPITWSGLSPEEIEADIDLFEEVSNQIQATLFNTTILHLKEICLLLYACLNEKGKFKKIFESVSGVEFPSVKSTE
ncbi:MAG: hypothetical protein R3220_09425, partial [Balneolaceae bacterium]|nr:hypothetical protein [Balneolaceae bacterium]